MERRYLALEYYSGMLCRLFVHTLTMIDKLVALNSLKRFPLGQLRIFLFLHAGNIDGCKSLADMPVTVIKRTGTKLMKV